MPKYVSFADSEDKNSLFQSDEEVVAIGMLSVSDQKKTLQVEVMTHI